jgi:hypothetical protein
MTLIEFEHDIYAVATVSPICDIPTIRRLTPTSINLRINVTMGGFIDAFYNAYTGTVAFAWICCGQRSFGADNTGGWHIHSFEDPEYHNALSGPMTFADFVAELERYAINK